MHNKKLTIKAAAQKYNIDEKALRPFMLADRNRATWDDEAGDYVLTEIGSILAAQWSAAPALPEGALTLDAAAEKYRIPARNIEALGRAGAIELQRDSFWGTVLSPRGVDQLAEISKLPREAKQ
jgi:hypothetical protein